jgi:hypothetical protein
MIDKTALWDRLGKTDPKHTKGFQRAGGFKGTAIKPMWSFRRMTEEFGACGEGWGINEPKFQIVEANEETLVFCTVSIWHGARENVVFGVGGDKAVGKNRNGAFTDDEAFKKSFTDAITNALKLIGVGADVHMGLFDDSKYVNEAKAEFAEKRENPHVTRPEDIVPEVEYDDQGHPVDNIPLAENNGQKLRVVDQRPIFAGLQKAMHAAKTVSDLQEWGVSSKDLVAQLKPDWQKILRGLYKEHMDELRNRADYNEMKAAS